MSQVCIKVPPPRTALRAAYEAREDREEWLRYRLGADGVYVA